MVMNIIKGKEDIADNEFEEILLLFYNNYNEYLIKFVIPYAIASYLANGYTRDCLSNCSLINHINSALDIFNVGCNVDELIPQIELILRIKFNLKITKNNPLKLIEFILRLILLSVQH